MTERTPEEIAAGLSEAQKRAMLVLMPEKGRWKRCGLIFWSLQDLGLVRRRQNSGGSTSCTPTKLGLAVRTLIEKDSRRG